MKHWGHMHQNAGYTHSELRNTLVHVVMEWWVSYLEHTACLRRLFYILLLRILDLLDKTQQALDRRCHQLTEDVVLPLLVLPLLYYLRLQIEDFVSRLDIFTIKLVSLSTLISSLEVINNVWYLSAWRIVRRDDTGRLSYRPFEEYVEV